MPELRRLAADLINRPVVPTPELGSVEARAARYRQARAARLSAAGVALCLVLALVGVGVIDDDGGTSRVTAADDDLPVDPSTITLPTVPGVGPIGSTTTTSTSTTMPPTTTTTTTVRGGTPPPQNSCPGGQNAGATDVGVTADRVRVLVGSSSLVGARAYAHRVNAEGGVCGRMVEIVSGGEAFARIPDPLAPAATGSVPVVGGEGVVAAEYASPWAWNVGTSAASQARIMVRDAWDKGARTFAIVYDTQQAFGTEADAAFAAYVQKLGGTVVRRQGIAGNQASYASHVQQFNDSCASGKCDLVAMFLGSSTATTWMRETPAKGRIATDMAQLVMSTRFAQDCRSACDGVRIWAPYAVPVDQQNADQQAYVSDVRAESVTIDVYDVQVMRSYLGAQLVVEGMWNVGANLTRERFQSALDSITFNSGLVPALRWSSTRYANTSARAVSVQYKQSFNGFRLESGFVADPGA